jgi:hemolysin III
MKFVDLGDRSEERRRLVREEIANSVTHGLGFALSLAGLAALAVITSLHRDVWQIVSCAIYGATLVILYASSTLYHSLSLRSERLRHVLRILDHSSIYLLIAGTYTPFMLVTLRGGWGWSLFGVIWGMTLAGILFKVFFVNRFEVVSTLLYLLMGWLVIVALKPLLATVPMGGLLWLLAGGLAYSVGVVFFAWERLPYNHAIWHLFVLAGSVFHFLAIFLYTLPNRAG